MSEDQLQDAGRIIKQIDSKTTRPINKAKELLEKVKSEKAQFEQDKKDKQKADEFVNKVFTALTKTHTRRVIDPNTRKFIGIKFRYVEDSYGKDIYDYVAYNTDPFEQKILEKLEIKFDPNDPKDGSWIDKPININWLNTKY